MLSDESEHGLVIFQVKGVPVEELEGECHQLNIENDNSLNDKWLKAGKIRLTNDV
jgi:hypothetical protein